MLARTCAMLVAAVAVDAAAAQHPEYVDFRPLSRADIDASLGWVPPPWAHHGRPRRGCAFRSSHDGAAVAWLEIDGDPDGTAALQLGMASTADDGDAIRVVLDPKATAARTATLPPVWIDGGAGVAVAWRGGDGRPRLAVAPRAGGEPRLLPVAAAEIQALTASADGSALAAVLRTDADDEHGALLRVQVFDAAGAAQRAVDFPYRFGAAAAAGFAADGRRLAVVADGQLYDVPPDGPPRRVAAVPALGRIDPPRWLPPADAVLLVGDAAIARVDLGSGAVRTWTAAELHGRIVDARPIPNDAAIAVVVLQEWEPPLVDFVRTIGHAPTQWRTALLRLAPDGSRVQVEPLPRVPVALPSGRLLPYVPRYSELLAQDV